ncbi:MAG: hypothetical protein LBS33_07510 [Streptococcaceae bacterium]|jgi:hypothetical protein|nr:hypothetical protein [Streptococcaceae bacterium]
MAKIKNKKFILFLSLLSIMLGGCGVSKNIKSDDFSTKEKVQKVLLAKLKEKYDEVFQIKGREIYETSGLVTYYSCEVKDSKEKVFSAYINNRGEFKDNYFAVPYRDEAIKNISSILNQNPHVKNVSVDFKTPTSSKKMSETLSLSKFISETGSDYNMKVDVDEQKSDEDYATIILNILNLLYEKQTAGFTIRITSCRTILYEDTYNLEYDNKRTDITTILETMESQKVENSLVDSN